MNIIIFLTLQDKYLYQSTGCPSGWWICFGYGVPYYGGWVCSPFSFFALGPSIVVGIGGGFDLLVIFMFIGGVVAVVRRFCGSKGNDEY